MSLAGNAPQEMKKVASQLDATSGSRPLSHSWVAQITPHLALVHWFLVQGPPL